MSILWTFLSRSHLCCRNLTCLTNIKNYSALRACFTSVRNYSALRDFSTKTTPLATEVNDQELEKKFKEIYRFSYIRIGHAISSFKWPQTLLVAFVFPNIAALYFSGYIELDLLIGIIISGLIITANVYAYGSCFDKAVGFLYLSEDGKTIKISYLDFWGVRVNKECPVDDVVPLTDCPASPIDYVYRTINFYSTDKLKLKLYMKAGGKITDVDRFCRVFGDISKF